MATLIDKLYSIRLGVQGENVANPVEIDMTPWVERFPNAGLHILFKRYNEITPYPVVTEFDGTILTWIPTVTDTAIIGVGYAEIRAIDPDTGLVKKSRVVPTSVENSVTGLDGEYVPEPFEEWGNRILAAKDKAGEYSNSALLTSQLVLAAGSLMNAKVQGTRLIISKARPEESDAYGIAVENGYTGTQQEWAQYITDLGRTDRSLEAQATAEEASETANAASATAQAAETTAGTAATQAAQALAAATAAQTAAEAASTQASANATAVEALGDKIKETSLVIPADAWEEQEGGEFTAVVSASALAGADTVIAGMSGSVTKEEYEMFCAAGVLCTGWAEGALTFTAYGEAPTMSLQISVMGVAL